MKIKITADSTCDLSEELLKKWDIALMPMHILMGEDSYLDGVTVHPADVFAYVNNGGKMPKSAAANLVEYTEFFAPFAKEYDAVIHISVSSKLSSCFQNARLAAGEFENVCVVDSQNICTGQGYLVLKAAKWAADGLTARAIQMKLQSLAKRVELSFVLDRLDFMAKSGRCSGVLAFGANLLGIKPALEVINGELKVVKKYRGSLPICVGKYITDRLADRDDIEDGLVFISSCQPKPGCMEAVKAGLKKYGHFQGMLGNRHRHHHRRLLRPRYHRHRVCTEREVKTEAVAGQQPPVFLTENAALRSHPEWRRLRRPCSSEAVPGCRPG